MSTTLAGSQAVPLLMAPSNEKEGAQFSLVQADMDSSLGSLEGDQPEIFCDALDEDGQQQQQIANHHHHRATPASSDSSSFGVDINNQSDEDSDSQKQHQSKQHNQPDATDHRNQANSEDTNNLEDSLDQTIGILQLALNNQFGKALSLCHARALENLYAALGNAALCFLRASLTLEREDLEAAIQAINNSLSVSSSKRKVMMSRLWWRPNYDLFTDEQIHAELVHAESLLMMALITFLADQSVICLVKGAFRIRSCYQTYKECMFILKNRQDWSSCYARKHFESGVRMGLGTFNLLMSYLPSRVLRFLEYVGFSGNRQIGVKQLDKSIELADGLRSVFSALIALTYHTYIEAIFGLGAIDSEKVKEINTKSMDLYPNSAFFLLFRGRYHQFQGELDEALDSFDKCIKAQNDWKQFHAICHWEMMWCYAIRMDWPKAAHYSDLLRKQSKWSPASYTYQYGTFLYAQLTDRERKYKKSSDLTETDGAFESETELNQIVDIMKSVPKLRIRYAGKTIPAEKFAITRSDKFLAQNNRLILPALEFLYIWNIFTTMRYLPECVERILDRLNEELKYIDDQYLEEEVKNVDDCCLVLLLKAMCLKILHKLDDAERCLLEIIDNDAYIKTDTFLMPYASLEMGLLKLNQNRYDQSRQWLQKAKHEYTGYLMETVVHFRIHAANLVINQRQHQPQKQHDSNQAQLSMTETLSNQSIE